MQEVLLNYIIFEILRNINFQPQEGVMYSVHRAAGSGMYVRLC